MYQKIIEISTNPDDIIDITADVEEIVEESKIKDGMV